MTAKVHWLDKFATFMPHTLRIVILLALIGSCIAVPFLLVLPLADTPWLLWLYGLDIVCQAGLGWLWFASDRPIRRHHIILWIVSLPWEWLVLSSPLVTQAMPWIIAFRLVRFVQLNMLLQDKAHITYRTPLLKRIASLMLNIVLIGHFTACGWLAIGLAQPDISWLAGRNLSAGDSISMYVQSIYWAITTMTTVGYGDITPSNNIEFLYAGFVMLIGASIYAFVIGNVASILGQLNARKNEYQERAHFVSQYLQQQNIPNDLIQRVQAFYRRRWERFQDYDQAAILSDLPSPLALDIKAALARHIVENVPILKHAPIVIRDVLLHAMKYEYVDPGSVIIKANQHYQRILFVIDGELTIEFEGEYIATLSKGDYVGNQSMILGEPTNACVTAKTFAELMYLTRDDYNAIKQLYPELVEVMRAAMAHNNEQASGLFLKGVVL